MEEKPVPDVRCITCGGLLLLASTVVGSIRCHRCKTINNLYILSSKDSFKFDIQPRSSYNKVKVKIETMSPKTRP